MNNTEFLRLILKSLRALFPEYHYIGYDNSAAMITAAKTNVPGISFISDWDSIDVDFSDSLLNLSSVIHEVYSYGTEEDVELFWKRVFESGFQYIAIRDMALSNKDSWSADNKQLAAIRDSEFYKDKLADYESVWGEIRSERDLVHFLLKYRYDHNWEREVRENYIPLSYETLQGIIPDTYEVIYSSHYTLPYIQWQVKKDFGIELNAPTHVKLVLKRRESKKEEKGEFKNGNGKKTPKKSAYKHKFNVGDIVQVTSRHSPLYGEVCCVMMRFQSGSYSLQIVGTRKRCTGFGRWMKHVPNPEDYQNI